MKREQQAYEIFLAALALEGPERDRYITEACADEALRAEVRSLMEAHHQAEAADFLRGSAREKLSEPHYSLSGRTLGDFLIRDEIGRGGFGVVYRAEQLSLAREAVVKVLHQKHHSNQSVIERFMREARLASRLEHPYTAHIYAFGAEADGTMWMAMEMIHGTPLDRLLQTQGALPLSRFIPLLIKICEVVQTAHDYGIIHRDLKPANVMVISRAGRLLPKLLDFGIAKWLNERNRFTDNGSARGAAQAATGRIAHPNRLLHSGGERTLGLLGSASYMPPEQWESATNVDARADIYALAVLSYEAITGRQPFALTPPATLHDYYQAHKNLPVLPLGGELPEALNSVMAKALAKRPDERYGSAMDFCQAFQIAVGYSERSVSLPQLDAALANAWMTAAPRPLAEAVAALNEARSAHQALNQFSVILHVAIRYIGILALASRTRIRSGASGDTVVKLLRKLRSEGLTLTEWWTLSRELCRPFARERDAFPIPELVALCFAPGGTEPSAAGATIDRLLEWQQRTTRSASETVAASELGQQLKELAQLLAALTFLQHYRIVSRSQQRWWQWMGLRLLPVSEQQVGEWQGNAPLLIDSEGRPVLSLSPIVQSAEPAPGSEKLLFFFEGRGRYGAKLVAMPWGFERHDEAIWSWFHAHLFAEQAGTESLALSERTPYLGLSAFTAGDTDLFFGRERESEAFLNRLRVQPLLVLAGASGAGKSSFIQAGVIAELPAGWRAITLRPGANPFLTLERRLQKEGVAVSDLRAHSERDPHYLAGLVRSFTEARAMTLVIVVDQFEELFTLCTDSRERQLFAEVLAAVAPSAEEALRLVIVMRDDFLMRAKQLPGLRARLAPALELLATPGREELLRIVKKPAEQLGYQFEDEQLPVEIVQAVADQPGALPLLAFTAARLWELRDRHFNKLLRKAYESMGGVGGALAQHAEATLSAMTQQHQRIAREAFRQLITSEGTRAILPLDVLTQMLGNSTVVEQLVNARLLVVSEGEQGIERVEIAHEALIDAWPRLVKWCQEEAENARLRDQLRAAARQWQERGRARGLLWRDEALSEYRVWRANYAGKLSEVEEAFGYASVAAAQRSQRRRTMLAGMIFTLLLVGILVLAGQRHQTAESARQALIEKARAEEKTAEARLEKQRAEEERQRAEENALMAREQSEIAKINAEQARQATARAEESAGIARNKLIELYEEQGRQELLRGNYARALIYLNEAYRSGRQSSALRFMIARCLQPLDAQLAPLAGHSSVVSLARFSPDGRLAITASDDNSVRVWEVESGKPRFTLSGHTFNIIKAAFSNDGDHIITASLDNTVKVWSRRTGQLLQSINVDSGLIATAEFNLDDSQMVIVDRNTGIKVWDLLSAQPLASFKVHNEAVKTAVFSPDNEHIATASEDRTVAVWHKRSGKQIFTLPPQSAVINIVNYSPDGSRMVTAARDGSVRIWDALQGKLLAATRGHANDVIAALFTPRGDHLITVGEDKVAKVWDAANGKLFATINGFNSDLTPVSFSPDGLRIIAGSTDNTARVWDTASGRVLDTLQGHSSFITFAAFSPRGDMIITASSDKTARLWDATRNKLLFTLSGHKARVLTASFSNDKNRIVTVSGDKTARLWNAHNGRLIHKLEVEGGGISTAAFSPDNNYLVTTGDNIRGRVWITEHGRLAFNLSGHRSRVVAASFSGDGSKIVTASLDGTANVSNARNGRLIHTLAGHKAGLTTAIFSPDSRYIVTAGHDSEARVWDADSGRPLFSLTGHKSTITALAYSRDGAKIASAGADRLVIVWNARTGRAICTLTGHKAGINSALFSPDGKYLVTASTDNTAKLWDSDEGRLIASMDDHTNEVMMAAFSPDGQLIVTASRDATAKVWEAATGKLLSSLEGHKLDLLSASFSPDGSRVITTGADNYAKVWNTMLESRSRAEIDRIVQAKSPFTLDQGRLIPKRLE